jgi:hypothetical protein
MSPSHAKEENWKVVSTPSGMLGKSGKATLMLIKWSFSRKPELR